MCDFSAKAAKQRAAEQNDLLITRKISTHTTGFTAVADPVTAVCLLPGTELAFDKNIVSLQAAPKSPLRMLLTAGGPTRVVHRFKTARFVQIEKDNANTHHDALMFPDGSTIKLNSLELEQTARVLQLPAKPKTPAEAEVQRRAEYV